MQNVHYLTPAVPEVESTTSRKPYSFDMTQCEANGFVLIDACIPAQMAELFFRILRIYHEDRPAG